MEASKWSSKMMHSRAVMAICFSDNDAGAAAFDLLSSHFAHRTGHRFAIEGINLALTTTSRHSPMSSCPRTPMAFSTSTPTPNVTLALMRLTALAKKGAA
jgi:hypothetical protein